MIPRNATDSIQNVKHDRTNIFGTRRENYYEFPHSTSQNLIARENASTNSNYLTSHLNADNWQLARLLILEKNRDVITCSSSHSYPNWVCTPSGLIRPPQFTFLPKWWWWPLFSDLRSELNPTTVAIKLIQLSRSCVYDQATKIWKERKRVGGGGNEFKPNQNNGSEEAINFPRPSSSKVMFLKHSTIETVPAIFYALKIGERAMQIYGEIGNLHC